MSDFARTTSDLAAAFERLNDSAQKLTEAMDSLGAAVGALAWFLWVRERMRPDERFAVSVLANVMPMRRAVALIYRMRRRSAPDIFAWPHAATSRSGSSHTMRTLLRSVTPARCSSVR